MKNDKLTKRAECKKSGKLNEADLEKVNGGTDTLDDLGSAAKRADPNIKIDTDRFAKADDSTLTTTPANPNGDTMGESGNV